MIREKKKKNKQTSKQTTIVEEELPLSNSSSVDNSQG